MKVRFYVDVPLGYIARNQIFTATTNPLVGVVAGVEKRIAFDVELPVKEFDEFVMDINGTNGKIV